MSQILFALRWYLVVQVFGLAALPLCLRLFRHLPDRGYGVSKPLGLLLTGWLFWLLASLGWLHNTAGGILVALAVVGAAGVLLQLAGQSTGQSADQPAGQLTWRTVVITEVVFALAFFTWCFVRARMPRIQTAGGEKWMEIAFLRAILRSETFPPHDPWLSGFAISYYYFGYVIVAMLARLTGISPSIAFNLGIATLFALTCTGAFGLVYNLVAAKRRRGEGEAPGEASPAASPTGEGGVGRERAAVQGGLLGLLLVAVMGNLEGLLEMLYAWGVGSPSFWRWLDVGSLAEEPLPFTERFFSWWQASRVIRDYSPTGGHQEVIDEFPGFSFLLGDMHPHLLALPFVLLALALALNLYLRVLYDRRQGGGRQSPDILRALFSDWPFAGWEFLVCAICLGGLGFLNTWDFPIYLFIVAAACALAYLRVCTVSRFTFRISRFTHHVSRITFHVSRFTLLFIALLAAGLLLYFPFWRTFQSQVGGTLPILPNLFNGTRLTQFLVIFSPLFFVAVAFVVAHARRSGIRAYKVITAALGVMVGGIGVLVLVVGLVVSLVQWGVLPSQGSLAYVAMWLRGEPIPGVGEVPGVLSLVYQRVLLDPEIFKPSSEVAAGAVLARSVLASSVWTVLGLVVFLVCIVFILRKRGESSRHSGLDDRRPMPVARDFVLLLFATGALLVLGVEFVYLRDVFGTRMNTVFKFYFQAWVLWGIAGGYALALFVARFVRRCGSRSFMTFLVVGVAVYPVLRLTESAAAYVPSRELLEGVSLPLLAHAYVLGLYLAWVLFATGTVVALVGAVRQGGLRAMGTVGVVAAAGVFIVAGMIYPALALPKRAGEYGGPATLDGAAYLARMYPGDYVAIAWLDENVEGVPVILETPGGGYEYEGRVSAHTGLPTLLGWAGHELQWRGSTEEQDRRKLDIEALYTSVDSDEVLTLLDKHGISYVYVGPVERRHYPAEGLSKFAGLLEVAYESDDVTIYYYHR